MPVLAAVVCTIARLARQLRGLRRAVAGETLAAHLQRARHALQQALIQAGGSAWDRRGQLCEQRAARWFSVFPGSVRPLSTTWPWTIRPALAVLWGVCWQFAVAGSFDARGGGRRTRVRATRLEGHLGLGWQAPHDGACE